MPKTVSSNTISSNIVRMILAGAAKRGADATEMIARFRIPEDVLAADDGRLPVQLVASMWEKIPREIGDEAFGLHLGEDAADEHLALIGRLFDASATLGQAVEKIMTVQRLVNDVHPAELITRGEQVVIHIRTEGSPYRAPRHAAEFGFAWMVVIARRATGVDLPPTCVRFQHNEPRDTREHRRIFRCPVVFGSEQSEIEFPSLALQLPHKKPDPALSQILQSYALSLQSRMPQNASFEVRVKEALMPRLSEGPTIDDVAHALKLSARTVQRYLQREDTTFAEVLDDVRRTVGETALREHATSIAQVSHALGFSDQSAFHKAFVRWTGKTPGTFRKSASE